MYTMDSHKINFIKDNINFFNVPHELIFQFIQENNIAYIQNVHGIFFTVNRLSPNLLSSLYELIQEKIDTSNQVQQQLTEYDEKVKKQIDKLNLVKEHKDTIEYVPLTIDFTNTEKKIMTYSYNLGFLF
jgi:hypothetical protein